MVNNCAFARPGADLGHVGPICRPDPARILHLTAKRPTVTAMTGQGALALQHALRISISPAVLAPFHLQPRTLELVVPDVKSAACAVHGSNGCVPRNTPGGAVAGQRGSDMASAADVALCRLANQHVRPQIRHAARMHVVCHSRRLLLAVPSNACHRAFCCSSSSSSESPSMSHRRRAGRLVAKLRFEVGSEQRGYHGRPTRITAPTEYLQRLARFSALTTTDRARETASGAYCCRSVDGWMGRIDPRC